MDHNISTLIEIYVHWATKDSYTIKEFMAAMPKQPAGLVEAFIGAFVDVKL